MTTTRPKLCHSILIFLLSVAAIPADAQTVQDFRTCQQAMTSPDKAIPACTVLIKTGRGAGGRLPALALASILGIRGVAYSTKGQPALAIADYTAALALGQATAKADLLNLRGSAYVTLNDLPSALADYGQALEAAKAKPTQAEIMSNRSYIYILQRKYALALSDLNKAIAMAPNLAAAYSKRAMLYSVMGEDQKASADYGTAIRLDPKTAQAYATEKERDQIWIDYLKDIQDTDDYVNWSAPPLDALRGQ